MPTIWHSLAWKEWHEHKWKLAALTAIMFGVTILTVFITEHEMLDAMRLTLLLCIVPVTLFVGLSVAAGERSRGTLPFLQALPVPLWRAALHKVAFGIVTVVIPVVATTALLSLWYETPGRLEVNFRGATRWVPHQDAVPFDTANWFVNTAILFTIVATSLFVWAVAFGVNRKDEISAGAWSLAAMVGWWLVLMMLWYVLLDGLVSDETARLRALAVATAPAGFAAIGTAIGPQAQYILVGSFSAAATHLLLAAWYVRRFGRISDLEIRSPRAAEPAFDRLDWLGPPQRSRISATAWKQFRESGPIVLIGLVGIFGLAALSIAATWREIPYRPKVIVEVFGGVTAAGGFLIALVVGIGVFLYDTGPQLNQFWRSRPINPHLWFWSKFVTGLMVVFAALYIPLVVIAWLMSLHTSDDLWHRDALMMPLVHVAIYAAAVAMTCLVRHAVYAAIFSVAALYIGLAAVWVAWLVAAMIGLVEYVPKQMEEMRQQQVINGLLTTAVVSTLVAWLAVRNDWGWRQGRA